MWGQEKGRNFVKNQTLVVLYKLIEGIGFSKLKEEVDFGGPMSKNSLEHNFQRIVELLEQWGRSKVRLGKIEDWKKANRRVSQDVDENIPHLWIDSSDFRLIGKRSISRSDPSWSYKENSPGRRFTFISDAKRRIRKVWGGYSPKVYDGDVLEIFKDWIDQRLKGATIIGDQHYASAQKQFKKVSIQTATRKSSKRKVSEDGVDLNPYTKKQKLSNARIKQLRARVESPFGWLKPKFK